MQNRVGELRRELKMSQQRLADSLGISRPYLSELENGKSSPGGPLMLKIAEFFKLHPGDIFFDNSVIRAEQTDTDERTSEYED